jgi:predicted acylesterase/phospholipase RssA
MYDALVLSSGGPRGVITLGAVHALRRAGWIGEGTMSYAGSSVGAVIAAGLAIGREPVAMLRETVRRPLQTTFGPAEFGIDSGAGLTDWIRRVLGLSRTQRLSLGDVPTLTGGKRLTVCVCNLDKRRAEYWSSDSHADEDLVDALRISCSIPVVFAGVRRNGDLYVDGAVADPFPVGAISPRSRVLGVRVAPSPAGAKRVSTVAEFVAAVVEASSSSSRRRGGQPKRPGDILDIDPGSIDALKMSLGREELREGFKEGIRQGRRHVKKHD